MSQKSEYDSYDPFPYDEDEDMGYVEPAKIGAIVLPALPSNVKFNTTSAIFYLDMLDDILVNNRGWHTRYDECGVGTYAIRVANNYGSGHKVVAQESGKTTIDPFVPTVDEAKNNYDSIDAESSIKKDKVKDKVEEPILKPILIPRPPFTQRLKKKQEEDSFHDIDAITTWEDTSDATLIEERLGVEALAVMIMNFCSDGIDDYDEMVCELYGNDLYTYAPKKLNLDLNNRTTPPTRQSIEEPPVLELKALFSHLRYIFLEANNTLSVIIVPDLMEKEEEALLLALQLFKRAIGWSIADIMGLRAEDGTIFWMGTQVTTESLLSLRIYARPLDDGGNPPGAEFFCLVYVPEVLCFLTTEVMALAKVMASRELSLAKVTLVSESLLLRIHWLKIDVGIVIDLEPFNSSDPALLLAGAVQSQKLAIQSITRLQSLLSGDIGILCDTAMKDVQKLTGYYRVMVYKFHDDNHGEIVFEIRGLDLEPYLGVEIVGALKNVLAIAAM
ncbi:hypothetical protein FXO37_06121 [Capsicum annuum]|nr:hypothetical protein FXO37_06121 [Capsicum annuum]